MTTKPSYHYHAWAHALSGHLTRPLDHGIEVQAGTTLPTTGGHHSSHVENFRFEHIVRFDAAYSEVSGGEKEEEDGLIRTSLATTVVEGLNILDVVTADRVVARVTSRHESRRKPKVKSPEYESEPESHILTLGSRFENLRVAGFPIEVELHHELFLKLDTFEEVMNEFAKNGEFWKMAHHPVAPGQSPPKLPKKIAAEGVVCCSLVKQLEPAKCPGFVYHGHYGHVLVVPEFGKIHMAEVLCEYGRKTLTMLRVELGSPHVGHMLAAQSGSNGRPPGGGG